MNLDGRWCDLSVKDYLLLERAWGWATGWLQLVFVAGAAWVGRFFWRRWRARRAARQVLPEPPPFEAAPDLSPPQEAFFDDEVPDGLDPLGVFGVPLTVLPPDPILSCGCGFPESHWINACPFPGPPLEDVVREWRRRQETGKRPPEDPPPADEEPDDPTPVRPTTPVE